MLTVSADKSAKVWQISEDGNGQLKKTLIISGSGGVDDMLVGCLWQNDHLVTVSLGGTISIFSASNLDKAPLQLSGHMKNITALAVLKSDPKTILSSSYDGLIVKWIQGVGFSGKLQRKENFQIKCLTAAKEEIVTSGFDNKVELASSFLVFSVIGNDSFSILSGLFFFLFNYHLIKMRKFFVHVIILCFLSIFLSTWYCSTVYTV